MGSTQDALAELEEAHGQIDTLHDELRGAQDRIAFLEDAVYDLSFDQVGEIVQAGRTRRLRRDGYHLPGEARLEDGWRHHGYCTYCDPTLAPWTNLSQEHRQTILQDFLPVIEELKSRVGAARRVG
jgi:hypothetical protein